MSQADDIYGPNTAAVRSVIDRLQVMTAEEDTRLRSARSLARGEEWDAAWSAARTALSVDPLHAERAAALNAAWDAEPVAACYAAWEVARALIVRDLISDDDFETLVRPWIKVMGRTWE